MDRASLKKVVPEIVRRLIAEDGVDKLILFGSVATGNYGPNSDIDLLVIKDHVTNKYKDTIYLRSLLKGLKIPIDLLVISHDDFDLKLKSQSNIYFWANRSGKVIYDSI